MLKDKIKSFPLSCGVYIMRDSSAAVLYVGKAKSLRKRLLSYFRPTSPKTVSLMENARDVEYIECGSEAQAFLLEAALIKEKKPKYNISLRDDKSYPYVEITGEEFPRIGVCRVKHENKSELFGPYTDVKLLREVLTLVRKVFPYRSCRNLPKKPCLFFHLKLCLAPCAGEISSEEYGVLVEKIRKILKGQRKELIEELHAGMNRLAKEEKFEEAKVLRDKITALESLYSGKIQTHELMALRDILGLKTIPLTVEAIDISNLSGSNPTGSVVVFKDGFPSKADYRRYRIKTVEKIDDYAMIAEVVSRRYSRLASEGAKMPDLIIIDGGKGHVDSASASLGKLGLKLPCIGIAKQNEEIWFPYRNKPLVLSKNNLALQFIQRIRDEAHRFARKYHILLRKKKLIS